jgi:hypothetical protein
MKQTAVEWLQEQLTNGIKYNPLEKSGYSNSEEKLFEQAIEMEKQQIIDGAQRQANRMYSEEEVNNLLYRFLEHIGEKQKRTILNVVPNEWFEQFKNK